MNIWNVLGITATEDKNEIKKAYRNKLRDAYEQALNYEPKEDDEETGDAIALWVKNWRNCILIMPEDFYLKNGKRFLQRMFVFLWIPEKIRELPF